MSLVYLLGSVLGIALLVGLNAVLFGRARRRLASPSELAATLAGDIPGFRPGACAIAADGCGALIENAADRAGYFVETLGDGVVTRKLSPDLLASVGRDGSVLSLRFSDFTLPDATLILGDENMARAWEARLKG